MGSIERSSQASSGRSTIDTSSTITARAGRNSSSACQAVAPRPGRAARWSAYSWRWMVCASRPVASANRLAALPVGDSNR